MILAPEINPSLAATSEMTGAVKAGALRVNRAEARIDIANEEPGRT